ALVEGWGALLSGHPDLAKRRLNDALRDERLAAHDAATALRLELRAQLLASDEVTATPEMKATIERLPSATRPILLDHLRRALAALDDASDATNVARKHMGAILPLPDAIVALTTDDERVVIADALLACDLDDAAHRITAALLKAMPSDQRRMLLH